MLKKYKLSNILLIIFLFSTINCYASTPEEKTIKVGLLDTPYNEMPLNLSLLPEYQKAYLAGVETAAHVAKKYHYNVIYKPFFYGNGPLDILVQVPKIKAWKADFVIGPSSSDQFLLLRTYLTDMLVLTSYASDKSLQTLPPNFYSIFLPDSRIMSLLADYIKNKYPKKNIYLIEQADCKQCVDVGGLFAEKYSTLTSTTKVSQTKIIMDDISTIDGKKLMAGHEDDVILAFNTTYYGYITLIKHISSALPNNKLLFFSDQDNWGEEMSRNTSTTKVFNYESYRIGPILFDSTYPEYKDFVSTYYNLYRTKPTDAVSYATYLTVMSVISALNKNPEQGNNIREQVMHSYISTLKQKPNWFRPTVYGIYQLTAQGEVLAQTIPITNQTH